MLNILNLKFTGWQMLHSSILLISVMLFSGAAMADRPEWAGRGGDNDGEYKHKHKKGGDRDRDDDDRRESRYEDRYQTNRASIEIQLGGYFGDTQRTQAREYYRERSRSGHCPPGLAKKNNGCMPPGQARKWAMGESLPRDVEYEPIDPAIQIRLGTPPAGHKFIRVASDILLVAVGTGMVMDAIEDLGR